MVNKTEHPPHISRPQQILEILAEEINKGRVPTYAELARKLYLSVATIKFHMRALKERFNVESKEELILAIAKRAASGNNVG